MEGNGKNKILLIDDEPAFTEACRMTFKAKGFDTIVAVEEEEAANILQQKEPQLIILGNLTPAGQAFSFYRWIKSHPRYSNIPLIVIDARPEERALRGWRKFEGMQLEAEEYLTKPVEPVMMIPRVNELLIAVVSKINVLVVDDHTMVRDGISAVLALQKDIELVGEAVNGQEAIEKVTRLMPDVILMDIVMPVMSGLEATKHICSECPKSKVLVLTQYDEEENKLVARHSGAHGFIPKKAASAELVEGIKNVYKGEYYPRSFLEIGA